MSTAPDVLPVDPDRCEPLVVLYERLRRPCASYLRAKMGHTGEFDDLYQATVVRILQAHPSGVVTQAYFWTAFKSAMLDRVRSYGYRHTDLLPDAFDPPAHTADAASQLGAVEGYERIFSGLDPREEFWLRASERGFPLQELADHCGTTLNAVKKRVTRAREKAQATLAATAP